MKATLFVKKTESEVNFRTARRCTLKILNREDGSKEFRIRYEKGKMISVLLNEVESKSVAKMLFSGVVQTIQVENYNGINDSHEKTDESNVYEETLVSDEPRCILIESKMNYNPEIPEFPQGSCRY